ncbi:MAG: hypothetical protein B7O98_05010 [Zestosphaera tikiterensis]|uniref:BFN domain-containing protein n=1 Tax=Zestosphaera tikiterensis TaxID=1973259 RepID=A0A2R7Y5P9_9CREN|nr:MAG: hypothetical protein B7O98_05010 [Zestosphaera tikiterensis]
MKRNSTIKQRGRLLKVVDVEPITTYNPSIDLEMPALNCYLENGETFTLYNVPFDIAKAITALRSSYAEIDVEGDDSFDGRGTIYDVMIMFSPRLTELHNSIKRVVIDSYDVGKGVYSASLYLEVDNLTVKKTLIPSHALFLAMLFKKPVFVTEEVLEISKELGDEFFGESDDETTFKDV